MKFPAPTIAALLAVSILTQCDKPESNSGNEDEKEDLRRRVEQLEAEKREEAERKRAATEEELAGAKAQLKLALDALEKEQAKPQEKPNVDVKDAGKAVVVPEVQPGADPRNGNPPAGQVAEGDDYRLFFKELAPFGEWFGTEDYGYVWQPSEVRKDRERAWRPYTRGRWFFSDNGWTWVSEEPFGWATFHYGRWALLEKHGWAWVPGDEWAPAWVSWRQSDQHVGWAPLPPETLYNEKHVYTERVDTIYDLAPSWYTFVPIARFQDSLAPHCVPDQSAMAILAQSENVTDVRATKDGIYCGGPTERWMATRLGGKVQRCRIVRTNARIPGGGFQQLRGGQLSLFAPSVDAAWNPAVRPQRISGTWGRVAAVRGGGAMDRSALARYRADILARQEAAGRAIEQEEIRQALLRDRQAREEAARRAAQQCSPSVHEQLEKNYNQGLRELGIVEAQLAQPNLNPRQRAYAELGLKNARRNLLKVEGPYVAHMQQYHPREWAQAEAARLKAEAERIALEEARRRNVCQPSEHEQLETAYLAARGVLIKAEREVEAPNLNPKQLGYARLRLADAQKKFAAVENPYMAHLLRFHPDDHRRLLTEGAKLEAERKLAEERRRADQLAQESAERAREASARLGEEARRRAEGEAARKVEMEARARAEADLRAREAAAKAEAVAKAEAAARAEAIAKAEAARRAKEEEEAERLKMLCNPAEHRQLQAAYESAQKEFELARAKMNAPNLNPKQLTFARKGVGVAGTKKTVAERAFLAHLLKHHPQDHKRLLTELSGEAARERAENEAAEAERLAAERARVEAERAAASAEAAAKAEEMKRLVGERERALAAARAQAEEAAEAERRAREARSPKPAPGPTPTPTPANTAVCSPAVHKQLEAGLAAAQATVDLALKQMNAPNANPRQVAYARRGYGGAIKKLNAANAAFDAHMETHHPAEWKAILAERAAAAKKAKEEEEEKRKAGRKD